MSDPNFQICIQRTTRWSKTWLGRLLLKIRRAVYRIQTVGRSGGMTVVVHQRIAGRLTQVFTIQCYSGENGYLTTTVDAGNVTRFKRRAER